MNWFVNNAVRSKTQLKKMLKLVTYEGGEFKDPDGNQVTPVGSQGAAAGLRFNFSNLTAAADPGTGVFRLNNANPALATQLFIDNAIVGGVDVSAFIDSWVVGSKIILKSNDNLDTSMLIYTVGTITNSTGYRTVNITYVAGSSFTDAEPCVIQYYVSGANGADGADGLDGVNGASVYHYRAYASDASGNGFTTTFNASLAYHADKFTTSPIASPAPADFAGLWYKALGQNGADGLNGTNGTNGIDGVDGEQGNKGGMSYRWGASTGNADPTAGKIRLSTATLTPGTTVTLRINDVDRSNVNMESIITSLSGGDVITIRSDLNTGISFMSFRVNTPATDQTGYWNISLTVLGGAVPLVNDELLSVQVFPQGGRAGLNYLFDASVTSGDPGSGKIRSNNANLSLATNLFIDDEASGAVNMATFIATWVKNGLILLQTRSNSGTSFGIFKIVSVTDSGTYFTVAVTAITGTTLADKTECTLTYIPSPNISWDGVDLLDSNGVSISDPLAYNKLSDAPAASTMVGKAVIIKSLAGNAGGIPHPIYAPTADKWELLGGMAVIDRGTPNRRMTPPAATFIGAYTMASVNGGLETKITGTGVHGLLTATVITGGNTYIKIRESSGSNWVAGLYKITACTDAGNDFTIDHPYSASFGQPVFNLAGDYFIARRIAMPAMSSVGGLIGVLTYKFTASAAAKGFIVEIVATGGAEGSGYAIWTPNEDVSTNNNVDRGEFGFNNIGATNIQHRAGAPTDVDGWGAISAADTQGVIGAVETSAGFDLLIRAKLGAANDIAIIRNYLFEGVI